MGTNYIASCFPTSPRLPFLALPNSAHLVRIVARTQPNSRVPSADAPGTICIAFLSILVFHPPAGKLKICQPTHRSLTGFQYTSPVNQMIDPDMPLSFHEENYKSQNHGESTQESSFGKRSLERGQTSRWRMFKVWKAKRMVHPSSKKSPFLKFAETNIHAFYSSLRHCNAYINDREKKSLL